MTLVCFDVGYAFGRRGSETESAEALETLLACLIRLNTDYIKHRPGKVVSLYQSNVRYGRTKVWEPIPKLYARGYGDCKSLACALIAEYRFRGVNTRPVFRFGRNWTGSKTFHILVQTPDRNGYDRTEFEDPSRKLGMGQHDELTPF